MPTPTETCLPLEIETAKVIHVRQSCRGSRPGMRSDIVHKHMVGKHTGVIALPTRSEHTGQELDSPVPLLMCDNVWPQSKGQSGGFLPISASPVDISRETIRRLRDAETDRITPAADRPLARTH